jgi:high frequency lysogenization protein
MNTDYRLLALSACVQTLAAVDMVARGKSVGRLDHLYEAVFTRNAEHLAEVFPDPSLYRSGVEAAIKALSGDVSSAQLIRYLLSVIDLSGRLKGSQATLNRLGDALDHLERKEDIPQLQFRLADLYQDTLSTLGKRIQVTGDPDALQQARTAAQIRSLLLCAVRFAWLWDQLGGRRWHLILRRRSLLLALEKMNQTL